MTAVKKNKDVFKVPEIKVAFNKGNHVEFPIKINRAENAANLIRGLFDKGEIELHEVMFVIFLNRANVPIGYYKHSIGGIAGTVVDNRIILATAIKSLSSAFIISHNHPSGNTDPSDADITTTKQLRDAAKLLNIDFLDHIILTKDGYTSLADKGFMGVDSPYPIIPEKLVISEEPKQKNKLTADEYKALKIEKELKKL